jgi:sec-independent protein translocase protein TatC
VAKVLRPIGHEDRLSIIDHLDELRSRVIVCLAAFLVALGVCFWQNHALLDVLNRALPSVSAVSAQHGLGAVHNDSATERKGLLKIERGANVLATSPGLSSTDRAAAALIAQGARQSANALPRNPTTQEKPITTGPAEPFTITLTVAAYFALLFTLPVLIYEAYGFVIPALNPDERRVGRPLMAAAPALFLAGAVFAYLVVLPPAVHFLQGYNSDQFQILIQAKSLYTFEIFTMLGIGVAFQLPLGLLALHRLGVIDGGTLPKHWRYSVVIIAVIAAAMPGSDPVTTGLEALPLVVLFLASIVMLKIADRRAAARAAAEAAAEAAEAATQPFDSGLEPS